MQRAMQSLPSSRRSPSRPWVALSVGMNLKNFPKRLDSKTSCLRITVPENLDLVLEGLIRKVLREQPKMDDIYVFAADYFEMLLKIRDKIGTKFAADQLCPFHNDEDAHDMIKLATAFAKPGIPKTKTPDVEKTENAGTKPRRKESSERAEESKKTRQRKVERRTEKKTEQKLNETKPERPETLKLEPKTEDIGDDEEFLKSDSIKVLVEKELLDAEKDKKSHTEVRQEEKPEEVIANGELPSVIDEDNGKTEAKRADELVNEPGEESKESQNTAVDKQEDIKEEEENEAAKETETVIQNEKKDEAMYHAKDATQGEIQKELGDDRGSKQNESSETENKNDPTESAGAEETQRSPESEFKESERHEISLKALNETNEAHEGAKDTVEEKMAADGGEKDNRAEQSEAQEISTDEVAKEPSFPEEPNLNSDELCAVVDVLSIKPLEKDEPKGEAVKETKVEEPKWKKEEGKDGVETKAEESPTNKEKELEEVQKSMNVAESTLARKAEETSTVSPQVNVTAEPSDGVNSLEKINSEINPEDEPDVKTTAKEKEFEKCESGGMKTVPCEEQKPTEDNVKGVEESEAIEDDPAREEKTVRGEPPPATERETKDLESQFKIKEKSREPLQNTAPEKEVGGDESERTSENDIKFAGSSEVEEEELPGMKTETKAEEPPQDRRETEDNESKLKLEVSPAENEQRSSGKPTDLKDERTGSLETGKEIESEELKPKEEAVNVKDVKAEQIKKDDMMEAVKKTEIVEEADQAVEPLWKGSEKEESLSMQESLNEAEDPETAKIGSVESAGLPETKETPKQVAGETESNLTIPRDDQCIVVDVQHVVEVEKDEKLPENNPQPEGVQIKTIQTHYYDTLQVPEQVTKEYKVHPVKSGSVVDTLLNIPNILPSDKEQVAETSLPPLDLPKQEDEELLKRDLEDSLMTPSSSYSLNLSELSVQTISEMFLDSEKRYSALDKEERKYVIKTGEKCGDENHKEKREVEEIIQKTIVPSAVGATPVAPREDAEINEEVNFDPLLKNEKKQEPSMDSDDRADSSNGGKSVDGEIPVITVEVKTAIEAEKLEDEKKEEGESGATLGGESDVGIRVEERAVVPEGVGGDVREEKENGDRDKGRQLANDEPPASETVPKGSETSSGESESTVSSTATEIKRNDSSKRHFSATRTLMTTQSLDLDKRNPLLKTRSLSSFRQGVTDFEVWNAIEKELEEAATKIQSNFRGYKTRKKLQRGNAVQITTEESSCSTTPMEPESRGEQQQSTGEFHDSIVLSEHPR